LKVTIVIAYNIDRGWLSEAVKSAEKQEGWRLNKDYEIIVQQGHCNVGVNFNAAVKKAKGKYIKGCAEDDRLAPGCLQALYTFAEANNLDFVCADAYSFEGKNIIERQCSELPMRVDELAWRNSIHGGTILYRKSAMPLWNEDLWTGEEYDVTLRMAASGCKFGKLDEVVYWYRSHPKQKSVMYRYGDGEKAIERFRFIRDVIAAKFVNNNRHLNKLLP
jgi:glycosyltransferase involved in cell wall biosynthesis